MGVYKNSRETLKTDADRAPNVLKFLEALDELQKKFDLSLLHEDSHGAFEVSRGYGDSWVHLAHEITRT